jgi:hypothetical protein
MGRINGENVAGAAFILFSGLFLAASLINPVIASVREVFYVMVAAGVALVILGHRTYLHESRIHATIKS